ncbi:MAG: hypothetical protein DHS80DRAFT_21957 [Piptocephalis tieghemiana]|nr:MAG: hypothetical protein DHS80DRAFT_21957 [Piptocephalis tieghemiana]
MRSSHPWIFSLCALTTLLFSSQIEAIATKSPPSSNSIAHGGLNTLSLLSLLQPNGLWSPTYQHALTRSLLHRFYKSSSRNLGEQCQDLKRSGNEPTSGLIEKANANVHRIVMLLCSLYDKDRTIKDYINPAHTYTILDKIRELMLHLRATIIVGALDKGPDKQIIVEIKETLTGAYIAYDSLVNPSYSYFTYPVRGNWILGADMNYNMGYSVDSDIFDVLNAPIRMDETLDKFVKVLTLAGIAIDDRPLLAFHQISKGHIDIPRSEKDPLNKLALGRDLSEFLLNGQVFLSGQVLPQLGLSEIFLCKTIQGMSSCLSKIHTTIIGHWIERVDRWVQFLLHLLKGSEAPVAKMIQNSLLGLQEYFSSTIKGGISATLRDVLDGFHEKIQSSWIPQDASKSYALLEERLRKALKKFKDNSQLDGLLVVTINELKSMTGRTLQVVIEASRRSILDPAPLFDSGPYVVPGIKERLRSVLQHMRLTHGPYLNINGSTMTNMLGSLVSFLDAYKKALEQAHIDIWNERVLEARETVVAALETNVRPHVQSRIKSFNDPNQLDYLLNDYYPPECIESYLLLQSIRSILFNASQGVPQSSSVNLNPKQARTLSHALARLLTLSQKSHISYSFSEDIIKALKKTIGFLKMIRLANEEGENVGKVVPLDIREDLLSAINQASTYISRILPSDYVRAMASPS